MSTLPRAIELGEDETPVELRRYLGFVIKWLWLALMFGALGGGAAYAVSRYTAPTYEATTTLLVTPAGGGASANDALATERLTATYSQWLIRRPILQEVIDKLKLNTTPDLLARRISVRQVSGTQLLGVNVDDGDPVQAANIANELQQIFVVRYRELQYDRFAASEEDQLNRLKAAQADIGETEQRLVVAQRGTQSVSSAEADQLRATLAQQQGAYERLLAAYEDSRLAETLSEDDIMVIEPAVPPAKPIKPNKVQNTLLGALLGLMLAGGLAMTIEFLDTTTARIRTADDLEQLDLPNLGVIGRWRDQKDPRAVLAATAPGSSAVEGYRIVRTRILRNHRHFLSLSEAPSIRSLLITSPGLAEGKSSIAGNLAVVMAQAGLSVVLVDADLRHPTQHVMFDLLNFHGLTNVLRHEVSPDEVLQATAVEHLRVVTSGPVPSNPVELLGSPRMRQAIIELGHLADVLILDSPPTLAVADASVLASTIDGVILVFEAGRTTVEAARRSRDGLRAVEANLLGGILNKLPPQATTGYDVPYYPRPIT